MPLENVAAHESIFSPARPPSKASITRNQRLLEEARREEVLTRLRREHPEWQSEQILFAALSELNKRASSDFMREAAAHIAQWSAGQGVSLTRRSS